jgi:hypothetical protein
MMVGGCDGIFDCTVVLKNSTCDLHVFERVDGDGDLTWPFDLKNES